MIYVTAMILWAKIDDHSRVHDGLALWYFGDVGVSHYEDGVCAFLASFAVALSHAAEIFPESGLPNLARVGIMHESFITADSFAHHRMHHWHGDLFKREVGGLL